MRTSTRRLPLFLGLLAGALLVLPAQRAAPPDLKTLFTHQAPIHVTTERLSRLELPLEVLSACRTDLSDLRVFDASDREVPFLLETGPLPGVPLVLETSYTLEVLEVERQPGDMEDEWPRHREVYELAVPDGISPDVGWDLVFEALVPFWNRRVKVSAVTAGGEEVVLVEAGSVFRLRTPPRQKTRLRLPSWGERVLERLIVTLEGTDGIYLGPVIELAHSRSFDPRERAVVELTQVSRREVEGSTIVELERPGAVVPDLIRLATSTRAFHRPVEVWDEGPGSSDEVLGSDRLFRVTALATVEEVDLPVKPARGDRLRVVIGNGDSPLLEDLSFAAVIRRPELVFALTPGGADEPSGRLRFGGGRAFRPRYDLEHLRTALALPSQGERAELAGQLHQLPPARLGDVQPNPLFDPAPVLGFAMRPAAPVDVRLYSRRRSIETSPSPEGLTRLRLRPEDLAAAQPDLDDLRIVDSESRQWAYLLERDAGRELRPLEVKGPVSEDGSSEYELILPAAPATLTEVVLHADIDFYDRAYQLRATLEDQERTLARGRMAQRIGDPRPARIRFPPARADSLTLVIEDGNDAPLQFERVEAEFPVPDVYFAAPHGSYSLLLGNPDDTAPQYELARVREVVLAVRSREAAAGELAGNPDYSARARLTTGSGAQQTLLWVVLIGAVVFLGWLTLRLARREGKGDDRTNGS